MDNYEINILKRDGNWKKVNPNDRVLDTLEKNEEIKKPNVKLEDENSSDNFLYYLNEINSIISKLEILETEKNTLNDQLKYYEQEILNKKKSTEDVINLMTKEKEMLDKTISVIKNLKNF